MNAKKIMHLASLSVVTLFADCRVVGVSRYDFLNVHNTSDPDSYITGKLPPMASGIKNLGCVRGEGSGTWCKIGYEDGNATIEGWVNSRYLFCDVTNSYDAPMPRGYSYCAEGVAPDDVLNIRIGPFPASKKIGEFSHDAKGIEILKCIRLINGSRWCKVIGENPISGWVNSRYITPCKR